MSPGVLIGVALAALLAGAAIGMLAGYLLAQERGAREGAQADARVRAMFDSIAAESLRANGEVFAQSHISPGFRLYVPLRESLLRGLFEALIAAGGEVVFNSRAVSADPREPATVEKRTKTGVLSTGSVRTFATVYLERESS